MNNQRMTEILKELKSKEYNILLDELETLILKKDEVNDVEKCMTPSEKIKEIKINPTCRHYSRIITKDYQKKQILSRCANCNHRNGIYTPSSVGWESLLQLMMWQPEE